MYKIFLFVLFLIPSISWSKDLKGWHHLANMLIETGEVSAGEVAKILSDSRMPPFEFVTFRLKPKESYDIYSGFYTERNLQLASKFLEKHYLTLKKAGEKFNIEPSAMVAILLIETKFGSYTGDSMVLNRLARVSNVIDPQNLRRNYEKLKQEDPTVTFGQVADRAKYLKETFLPEIIALIKISKMNNINIFNIKGSIAGAFGLPQFLPRSYLNYGIDGNKNGKISLFEIEDAIYSIANYLSSNGWKIGASEEAKRKAIWAYNHSDPYIDTIWKVHSHFRDRF